MPMNYSSMRDELIKIATADAVSAAGEDDVNQNPEPLPPHPLLTAAKSTLGFGAGMGAGYLATRGIDKALRSGIQGHPGVPKYMGVAVPALSGLGGLALAYSQGATLDKMRQDTLKRREMLRERKGS
jgi:hypothetical protein